MNKQMAPVKSTKFPPGQPSGPLFGSLFGPPVVGMGSLVIGLAAAWQLSRGGVGFSGPLLAMLAALFAALAAVAYAFRAQRRALDQAARAQADAANAEAQMQAVFDILPEHSICTLFDANDRLVRANAGFMAMYPLTAPTIVPGVHFETILRRAVALGEVADARGREETWVQQRLAQHRAPATQMTQSLADDRWVHINERRTADGWVVGLHTDVTDAVRKERDLERARRLAQKQRGALELARLASQEARALLEAAIEAMPVGIEIFDPQDKLVICNEHIVRLYEHIDLRSMVGLSFETIVRASLRAGWISAAVGREEEWMVERMALRGTHVSPMLQEIRGGRWMHSYEIRTPQGYIVAARMEVTDMVRQRQALEVANTRLAELSATDGLTGIANRRHFDEKLAGEWLREARHQEPLALLIIDIDHFKHYNDHYGHLAGDECLRRVAKLLHGCLRRSGELAARYGGEEFALLMPSTNAHDAQAMAQHCMDEIAKAQIAHGASPTSPWLTLSIGVACAVPDAAFKPEALVDAADAALYRAKNSGRNRFDVTDLFSVGTAD
jgi:diguanylate cyclase (GGDEF)-like protein